MSRNTIILGLKFKGELIQYHSDIEDYLNSMFDRGELHQLISITPVPQGYYVLCIINVKE